MIAPNYGCTQAELYTIARMGWNSCRQHLTDFADFKARYTDAYIDARLVEVTAAEILPDFQARNEAAETQRILLTELTRNILDGWQRLKRYIADAFPKNLQKPKLEAAGATHYRKAAGYNWDSVQALLVSATNFMTDNLTELTANDNMPPAFQTGFEAAKTEFETGHQAFLDSEETARIGRQTKIEANNEVHRLLMVMMLDGQELFKRNEAVKAQFIFDRVLQLASGSGNQGVKGYVTDSATDVALAGVTVTIVQNERSTTTDSSGRYEMIQVAAGTYTVTFTKTGYEPLTVEGHEVQTGVVGTLNVAMSVVV